MRRIPEEFPGLRAPAPGSQGLLLWDGDCRVCRALAKSCELPNRSYQSALALLPEEVRATAPDQMIWIEPDGSILGGSRAWLRVLDLEGHTMAAALLGSRILRPFTWLGYRLFARLRFMFGVQRRSQQRLFGPNRSGPGGS